MAFKLVIAAPAAKVMPPVRVVIGSQGRWTGRCWRLKRFPAGPVALSLLSDK
jgi:hypothetical protein